MCNNMMVLCIATCLSAVREGLTEVLSVALQGVDCRRRPLPSRPSISLVTFSALTRNCSRRSPSSSLAQPEAVVSVVAVVAELDSTAVAESSVLMIAAIVSTKVE